MDRLDAVAVRRWCAAALVALRDQQDEIDALNVFPVADSDTGTNLVLTLRSAAAALAELPSEAGDSAAGHSGAGHSAAGNNAAGHSAAGNNAAGTALLAMARGAVLGARGNSGVILSQVLAALAEALAAAPVADGRALATALVRAAEAGYRAVATPVEGTMLSVARAAADAAVSAGSDHLPVVTRVIVAAAGGALRGTPGQLAALGLPAVTDAGGRGLLLVFQALDGVVSGDGVPRGAVAASVPVTRPPAPVVVPAGAGRSPDWEVQYLLELGSGPGDAALGGLRERLMALGESVVLVRATDTAPGPRQTWMVHVHTDDIGAAIEAALDVGRPFRINVTSLDRPGFDRTGPDHPAAAPAQRPRRGVVALVPGAGLADVFEAAGAVTVPATPTAPPSVAALLAAVERTGAPDVVLLANDAIHAVLADQAAAAATRADQAHHGDGPSVTVLHTRSPVQGLAALAVADPHRPLREDVVAMSEAASATRVGEVLVASGDALTIVGPCRDGDAIALVDGDVVAVDGTVAGAATALLDRTLAVGGELVTLVPGVGADPGLVEHLRTHLAVHRPFCEVQVFEGGQAHAVLLVGVE